MHAAMMRGRARRLCSVWAAESGSSKASAEALLDRKSTRLNSSHQIISYAVFCLKKKNTTHNSINPIISYRLFALKMNMRESPDITTQEHINYFVEDTAKIQRDTKDVSASPSRNE